MLGSQLNGQFGSQATIVLLGDQATVTAAGTTLATATALTAVNNIVTTASANQGVRLPVTPTVSSNDRLHVANQTTVNVWVYPPSGGAIGANTANRGAMLAPNKAADFFCIDGTNYTAILSA